jgi:preprotein translocase subunit YajC
MLEGPAPDFAGHSRSFAVLALLAQATEQQSPMGSFQGMFVMISLFFVIFYFLVMRPQSKQQNAHKDFLSKLGKGDEVITSGGVVGKVDRVQGDLVFVDVGSNVKLRVLKAQISGPYKAPEEKPAAAEEPAKK